MLETRWQMRQALALQAGPLAEFRLAEEDQEFTGCCNNKRMAERDASSVPTVGAQDG